MIYFKGYKIKPKANLRGADLRRADLGGVELWGADLSGANLSGANLKEADLRWVNFRKANLKEADLRCADLWEADLREADLREADLRGAGLMRADLTDAKLPDFQICPQNVSFVGWKKLIRGTIAKLEIPAEARRTSSLVGRKCRAEFAKVLEGNGSGYHRRNFYYTEGEMVYPDGYDGDIRIECTHGIHFFMTRTEAEEYL